MVHMVNVFQWGLAHNPAQVIPTIAKSPRAGPRKSTSWDAAYQSIRRLCKKNARGVRKVSDAIAQQFLKGGKGQTDLITAYQQAGGNIDPCSFFQSVISLMDHRKSFPYHCIFQLGLCPRWKVTHVHKSVQYKGPQKAREIWFINLLRPSYVKAFLL